MTDATGEPAPPQPAEDKRRIIEDAILAFRPDVAKGFPRRPPAEPGPALAALAAAVTVRRLTKHRRLIDGFRRSTPEGRKILDGEARRVLESTVEQDLPDDQRQVLVATAKSRLDEVAVAPGEPRLEQEHWNLWVRNTDDIFRFTTHERTFAACNDNMPAWKQTPDGQSVWSRSIVAQFYSDQPPAAFRAYVQPENWPKCSQFWDSVVGLPQASAPHAQTPNGYDWDFNETVNVIDNELTVPLQIGFRELPDGSSIWTQFNLSQAYYNQDTLVDVDTGMVSAMSVSDPDGRTLVQATKWIHWRFSSRQPDLTALSCDFGWSELMEEMAYGCAQGFPPVMRPAAMAAGGAQAQAPTPEPTPEPTPTPTPADAIKQFAEAVTMECQQAIGEGGLSLERLLGRFTGRSWDAGWINDLLDMGLVAADHYGNIASDIRRLADSLHAALAGGDTPAEGEGHG